MVAPGQQLLWRLSTPEGSVHCLMLTCCSGAELQVLSEEAVILRELYPDKSDLYERARQLRTDFERALTATSAPAGLPHEASAASPDASAPAGRAGLD